MHFLEVEPIDGLYQIKREIRLNYIDNFSIEKINELKSKLFFKGKYTGTNVSGIALIKQLQILDKYYLIITDSDCPYEEVTNITLIDNNFKALSRRWIGFPCNSWFVTKVEFIDSKNMNLFFCETIIRITIRNFSIPYLMPKIKMTRIKN